MNNNHLVLISGKSSSGKSASLMAIDNPEGVMYLNCENGKKLPFKTKFKELVVTDPIQIYQAFEEAEKPAIAEKLYKSYTLKLQYSFFVSRYHF